MYPLGVLFGLAMDYQMFLVAGMKEAHAHGEPARKAVIEGDGRLIATADPKSSSGWKKGERVFHQKFGYGEIAEIEGNKLEIDFEAAGRKRVMDSFVTIG